ncbi:MAG TPA: hypothetical protein VGI39_03960 [Polyangiaceae bacterium]|jgi:hypothetical protein
MRTFPSFLALTLLVSACTAREVLDLGGNSNRDESFPDGGVGAAGPDGSYPPDVSVPYSPPDTGTPLQVPPNNGSSGPTGVIAPSCDAGTCELVAHEWAPRNLVIDGPYLYWLNQESGTSPVSLMRVLTAGGPVEQYAAVQAADLNAYGMTLTAYGDALYWLPSFVPSAVVQKTALDGTNRTALPMAASTAQGSGFSTNGNLLAWVTQYDPVASIVTMPIAGGTPTTILSNVGGPEALAIDGTNAYWVLVSGDAGAVRGDLMKTPLDGGPTSVLVPGIGNVSGSVATDGVNVYWLSPPGFAATDAGVNSVMKVPVNGGAPAAVASVSSFASEVVVDDTSLYVVSPPDGTISKITPK